MALSAFYQEKLVKFNNDPNASKPGSTGSSASFNKNASADRSSKGEPLDNILDISRDPPKVKDMNETTDKHTIFMISPFKYDQKRPNQEPIAINHGKSYVDKWDQNHVRMPCSSNYVFNDKKPAWPKIRQWLSSLQDKCNKKPATFEDLKRTIELCGARDFDFSCLETLITKIYQKPERNHFMSMVLSYICRLALNVDTICSRSPPLLRTDSGKSVTMSQLQAASLLACAFFCLFPYRFDNEQVSEYQNFQNPNFNSLYKKGPAAKIEKLRCILHYFERIAERPPTGVISFRRSVLTPDDYPQWAHSRKELSDLHLTSTMKIEDIDSVLQVDFANEYIGGGVLGAGCVQEEIRFSICPEMLVSLLICEKMQANECIFLIGCERYSNYQGYADSFKFADDYTDDKPKDNWGRKWCHLVAMDAKYFRDPKDQYDTKYILRELLKAYISFRPRKSQVNANTCFGIATGNWGCGVFNGDKQLKAMIQWMAASEVDRPLIYAAYYDQTFVDNFAIIYEMLKSRKKTVGDLHRYLLEYSERKPQMSLFDYIIKTRT